MYVATPSAPPAIASAVPQNAPSAYVPQTVYIPDNGRYDQTYHSTASCGGMEDMAEREFDAVKRLYAPCAVCWVTPEYDFLLSVYYGRAVAEVRQQTQSQAGSAGADAGSTSLPQTDGTASQGIAAPQNTPAQSGGHGLLSSGLSSLTQGLTSGSGGMSMVWISNAGKQYHRTDNCENIDPLSAYQKTLDWAIGNGYTQCSLCW